jgi:hypothetical protein
LEDQTPTFDDLDFAATMANITLVPLRSIAAEHPPLFDRLRGYDPVRLAATIGGLLTVPELQSNCIRLEALVHLSLAMARGMRPSEVGFVSELFAALDDGVCGRCEDPAEDVFVTSVGTPRGNFRVLQGIWESAGFLLQRIINTVGEMPRGSGYDDLRENIYCLLRLSDAVCERAGLVRFQLGSDLREKALPESVTARLGEIGRLVRFSERELRDLGVSIDRLAVFAFLPDERENLLDEAIGHSSLERCPVLFRNDELCLALPTAVSCAIRRYVVERMVAAGMREALLRGLANEYASAFARVPLLGGGIGAPLFFQRTASSMTVAVMAKVELGRFLNFLFCVDTLEGFETAGLVGHNRDVDGLQHDLAALVDQACEAARKDEDFRDGIILVVGCGIGRGIALSFERLERPDWRLEFISAADLYTLSWVRDFKPLSLWRLFEAEAKAQSLGITLLNVNGLLNMVAWARFLDGHLIPHSELPDDFVDGDSPALVMIDLNGLRRLRHDVATGWDPHVEQDPTGRWIWVRKDQPSALEEDRELPLYAGEEKLAGGGPPAVYIATNRRWWAQIELPSETSGHIAYQRWKMMTTWLSRAAPVLDHTFFGLPPGPILWRARFSGPLGNPDDTPVKMGYAEAAAELSIFAEPGGHELTTIAAPAFERAHFNDDNIAERVLVERLVEGIAILAGRELGGNEMARLVAAIVPDNRARHAHMFLTQAFRDCVQDTLPSSPLIIDDMDAATLRLGLGWRVRDKSCGSMVEGKTDCLAYLSALVKSIEEDLCKSLSVFDRLPTLRLLLQHHESAVLDRERWLRTAAAVLSLSHDKAKALEQIARHEFQLNTVFQPTRLLCEIAICECRLSGGRTPAQSDLSRLMAIMMMVQEYGGWSDAIRWDVMEPRLKIQPLGDVHARLGFLHQIVAPFARATADVRVAEAVESYSSNLMLPTDGRSVEEVFEAEFLAAWRDEAGAALDDYLNFIDYVEWLGVKEHEGVLALPKRRLHNIIFEEGLLSKDTALAIVEFLTLCNRPKWRDLPLGYDDADRQPWRYRRRLSLLRKPLLQIDDADEPTIVVAPGILRDALTYMVGNYHRGDFPLRQLKSAMRSWAGTLRDRRGQQFSRDVAERLKNLGWKAEPEVKVTKLLRRGFEKDFGDVDVLAWSPVSGRILIIECKDVQYRKAYGEIAEQLADFRGEKWPDGRRDYLLRHLDRVEVISRHLSDLAKYVGMPVVHRVESHLIFRNPVPMEFALSHMTERVTVGILDRLDKI